MTSYSGKARNLVVVLPSYPGRFMTYAALVQNYKDSEIFTINKSVVISGVSG